MLGFYLHLLHFQVNFVNNGPYTITFEGVIGAGVSSDIAVDDIIITPGVCPVIGSCNFEYVRILSIFF